MDQKDLPVELTVSVEKTNRLWAAKDMSACAKAHLQSVKDNIYNQQTIQILSKFVEESKGQLQAAQTALELEQKRGCDECERRQAEEDQRRYVNNGRKRTCIAVLAVLFAVVTTLVIILVPVLLKK
jgi:hypothetical protein